MSTQNLAVAYIRGSTEEQQNTLVAQRHQIEGYCAAYGIELAHVFIDSGESAYSTMFFDRPVVKEMRDYMARTGIRQIIIAKLDRAFRNTKDTLNTVDALARKKIDLHILDIKLDTTTPTGRCILTVFAAMAEMENGVRSLRQKSAFAAMRRQHKLCGNVPYGWIDVGGGRLAPHPMEQKHLQFILEQAKTYGDSALARALNDAGIPSRGAGRVGKFTNRSGNVMQIHGRRVKPGETIEFAQSGKWHASTVHSVREHAQLAEPQQIAA